MTAPPVATAAAGTLPDDACTLVPTAEVATALGVDVDAGVADGSEVRRVCTFQSTDGALGVTVGVESGSRFEHKADTSRRSLGVDGDEVDGLGDRALFFYSDADLPEGVGGILVAVDELTIDITLQGQAEAAMRDASVAIATTAVSKL